MSKRPKTAGSFLSRVRRPFGRLRDMPIWSKLGLIMIVPTIATVVVGTSGLIDHLETLDTANRAGDLANLVQYSGELVDDLQNERAAAVLLLGADKEADRKRYTDAYTDLHKAVDAAKAPYSRQRAELSDLPTNFDGLLDGIDQNLANLPGTRSQVFNGKLKLTEAAQAYEGLIADLLDIRDSATQLAGDTDLGERMRAAASTARAKEFLSVRRVVVHRALIQNNLTPVLRTEYIATETGQQQALQSFLAVANRAESELYQQTVAGSDQREADTYSGWIRSTTTDSIAGAPFNADQWDAAMTGNAKLIRTVEAKLDADVVNEADQLRTDVQRQVFLETGLLLGMLLLAILFAWLVARSMARSLRDLRQGALAVAQYGLPQAVARLRDPQLSNQLSPVQLANQIAEPLPVRSRDEFGQVTEAFNAVHLEAVRTAAEQAALRASVATMFVNLARRSQILVDRLIGHLDRLERGEEDPDRLAELFQLDHLATRMRRNDENLLVLAGADSTRVQREPAALIDVLRAAQSEVEHYTRIEFGVVDRDIEVAAHAVNDLVHLVAELFDNATAFSPPDSQVMVEARRVGDRASLYVEDRGIGISPDQLRDLNERLATPPMVDVAVSRMMGLVVVARLASRHAVKVELRAGGDRGTVAEVALPTSVLVPRALSGRVQQPGALPASPSSAPPAGPAREITPLPPSPRTSPDRDSQVTLGGRPFEPAARNGAGQLGAGAARSMPAWSDLTGVTPPRNGTDTFRPRPTNGQPVEPLPQRRATGDEEGTTDTGSFPVVPRQLPSSPEARSLAVPPVSAPPVSGQPYSAPPVSAQPYSAQPYSAPPVSGQPYSAQPYSAPPVSGQPYSAQPYSAPPVVSTPPVIAPDRPATPSNGAPPVWPPVATPERDAPPAVPERLAAALDMTTELPRVTRGPMEPPAAPAPAERQQRYADETMELPIFRELESAWFRTRRPAEDAPVVQPAAGAGDATEQFARVDAGSRTGQNIPTGTTGNPVMPNAPTGGGTPHDNGPATPYGESTPPRRVPTQNPWQTAADDGWRAASAASAAPVGGTTQTGLPKRVPMAQLVPGGVEKPVTSVQRRTPEAVRGLLSAYHRGVQRGRSNPSDGPSTHPESAPGGQKSSQSGLGPAAGSGQKEHEG
ncbi:sensor histidine kinase [Micromonospora echinofusca]|uniref:histidine kinase n=1 Tax=Micromonospora echinofusca TaxID=47858 RepID=A0ABS3VLX1_MICEH|nr:sensor histidine kinase [Micromonospora echinofusca]MBO4205520.1 HAMP domain-containing protein [Micromonospora echinofusca]